MVVEFGTVLDDMDARFALIGIFAPLVGCNRMGRAYQVLRSGWGVDAGRYLFLGTLTKRYYGVQRILDWFGPLRRVPGGR